MRYPNEFLEEIRARLPVSAVVSRSVRLRKSGSEWKGLSPFNKERTPSFFVNDRKQFYHCFSSGKHGDVFTFLMETEGLSFPEAVERLAGEAGLDLPTSSPKAAEAERRRAGLHGVMEQVAAYFADALRKPAGSAARDYLDRRGIPEDARDRFGLGYAPFARHGLRDHLERSGVDFETMVDLGLVQAGEEGRPAHDRFRDRVMIPIADARGRIVGFGGRALDPSAPAKYLNSPETPLFRKGHLLYNLHRARPAAHASGTLLCVEGYLDVIALDVAGIAHAVAPMGTALTAEQAAILWSVADEPVLCLDGDEAGRRAALRAARAALPLLGEGRSMRFALMPDGLDPDDLVHRDGAAGMARAVARSRPLFDVLWAGEAIGAQLGTPEGRAGLERRLRDAFKGVGDAVLRRHFIAEAQTRLAGLGGPAPQRRRGLGLEPAAATVLGALAAHPGVARDLAGGVGLTLPAAPAERLRRAVGADGGPQARRRLVDAVRDEIPATKRWMLEPGADPAEVRGAVEEMLEAERAMAGEASEQTLDRLRRLQAHLLRTPPGP